MTPHATPAEAAVENREGLAGMANQIASRYKAGPYISEHSTVDDIAAWLQWCDPNGCHTQELTESCDFYTLEEAWEALVEMLSGG